ncbi:gp19.4 protein [Escherichia phage K1F]|uniref:Gp19.4 protein n=1 Tax=Escherichia phage K1F TaxID=344021 RepID=Q2WC63_BPK1F|nr:gp19.4 protein [Escherichia phage K1F]CAJ29397.1 gp19.4 protein [Escherichia phage K1F]
MAKTKAVLKALATNRATYRFLAAVLLAAGVTTAGSQWVGWVETLICSLVSECR